MLFKWVKNTIYVHNMVGIQMGRATWTMECSSNEMQPMLQLTTVPGALWLNTALLWKLNYLYMCIVKLGKCMWRLHYVCDMCMWTTVHTSQKTLEALLINVWYSWWVVMKKLHTIHLYWWLGFIILLDHIFHAYWNKLPCPSKNFFSNFNDSRSSLYVILHWNWMKSSVSNTRGGEKMVFSSLC